MQPKPVHIIAAIPIVVPTSMPSVSAHDMLGAAARIAKVSGSEELLKPPQLAASYGSAACPPTNLLAF